MVAVKATPGSWEKAKGSLEGGLAKAVERGKMAAEDRDAMLGRITFTTDEHAVADCDLVIESIIEDLETKKALFRRLEHVCNAGGDPDDQYLDAVGYRHDGRVQASRPCRRPAFLQSGAGDEAGRDHPRLRDVG